MSAKESKNEKHGKGHREEYGMKGKSMSRKSAVPKRSAGKKK